MIINNIDPTLLKIGIFEIRWYGLAYVLGFLLTYFLIYRKKDELKIRIEQIDNLVISLFIGLLVGARIFHFLFSEPSIFYKNPIELIMLWHGGMSFFGAFFGAFLGAFLYLKKIKLDWKKFGDIIVIAAIIGLIFGRIANYTNSELVGTISNLPWCVVFQQVDNICRHPYQIYAALSHVLLLCVLVYVKKIKETKKLNDGTVFVSFLIGYSALRLITDFFRHEDLRILGLSLWQYVSIVVLAMGIVYLVKSKIYKPNKNKNIEDKNE
jgi:phosphatidylglycerol:prolipoprotein diacylglycerol transferase